MHRAITPHEEEKCGFCTFSMLERLLNITRLAAAAGLTPNRHPRAYGDIPIKSVEKPPPPPPTPKGAKVRRPESHKKKAKVTEEKNYFCLCGLLKLAAPRLNCAPAGTAPRPRPANSHARDRRASKYCRRKSHAAGGRRPPQICSPD